MARRFKSKPHIRYRPLAFRVFGEIRPLMDCYVMRVWDSEDGPPLEIVCDTVKAARRQQEVMREGDLAALEGYTRPWKT